jgi:hypothetical protein
MAYSRPESEKMAQLRDFFEHFTDAALAANLRRIARNLRTCSPLERIAILEIAADRLEDEATKKALKEALK